MTTFVSLHLFFLFLPVSFVAAAYFVIGFRAAGSEH
jgi:hypothetical protein